MCVISVLPYNIKDFAKIDALLYSLEILQTTELQETKRSLYNSWFHKCVLWLLYIYLCQTPGQKTVGMKLLCKYIAYDTQLS